MRLWKVTDKNGKTEVVKAWSMRHAQFVSVLLATNTLLLGRANPDNQDGWKKRV